MQQQPQVFSPSAFFRTSGIDTLVLGCTHYPLLKKVIGGAVGAGITLIDSATETAKEGGAVLDKLRWHRPGAEAVERRYFVTDTPARFETLGKLFLGDAELRAEQVKVGGA